MLCRYFDLSVALLSLSLMIDMPRMVLVRKRNAAAARSRRYPVLSQNTVVDGFLQAFINFLVLWKSRDFGATLNGLIFEMDCQTTRPVSVMSNQCS